MAYELKTKENKASVLGFLKEIKDEGKRKDSLEILKIMKGISGESPRMWGASIVGFGKYIYKYASGHSGEWMILGFSPRKQNISIYATCDLKQYEELLKGLGKYKAGVGCLYINKLSDVNLKVLRRFLKKAYVEGKKKDI